MNKKQEEIFNEAYYNYSKLLLKIIRMYVKDIEESKDILQEVFYKLLVKEPKFESVEHEKRWLIRVAINQAKDYHKTFWRKMVECFDFFEMEGKIQEKEKIDLKDAIDILPEKYKDVVLLYYYFGYSIKETAEILNVGESTVKMRLSRARNQLKIEMEEKNE